MCFNDFKFYNFLVVYLHLQLKTSVFKCLK